MTSALAAACFATTNAPWGSSAEVWLDPQPCTKVTFDSSTALLLQLVVMPFCSGHKGLSVYARCHDPLTALRCATDSVAVEGPLWADHYSQVCDFALEIRCPTVYPHFCKPTGFIRHCPGCPAAQYGTDLPGTIIRILYIVRRL